MSLETGKTDSVSEIVQKADEENKETKPAVDANAADTGQPAAAPTVDLEDPDQRELHEAQQALTRETGKKEETQPSATPAKDETAEQPEAKVESGEQPAKPDAKAEPKNPIVQVPRARLKEMKDRETDALRSAAYWKGRAEAAAQASPTDPTKGNETKALTPEQQLAAVRQQKLDLATQVDDGKLTTKEYEEQRQKLEDAEWAIREQTLTAKTAPRAQESNLSSDLYLEERTAQLERDHPYTALIESEEHWDFLAREAARQLAAEGVTFAKGNLPPAQAFQLRARISELTDIYGPIWTGKQVELPKKPGAQPAASAQPAAQGKPNGLSPQAQARAAKLEQAREAPPDLTAVGTTGNTAGDVSLAAIESMSDDEIAALPKGVRDRHMGRLPS